MRTLREQQFHLLMAFLVIASMFVDQNATKVLPFWNMTTIGLVTFALGLCWVALFAAHRIRNLHERILVLEERLERTSQRAEMLEDDARRRRGLPL